MTNEFRLIPCLAVLMSALSAAAFAQAPAAATAAPPAPVTAPQAPAVAPQNQPFATVNGQPISNAEFHSAFATYMRQTYYHGKPPEGGMEKARKEVADQLINKTLQLQEISRRGMKPDGQSMEREIAEFEKRNAANPMWIQNREAMLPGLRELLGQQAMLKQLEIDVRNVPTPTPEEVKAYYARKPELFTEPEKLRVRAIVLQVMPGAPSQAWEGAREEGDRIVRRIRGGADFAEQARLASTDENAGNGGDLGYLHVGMLQDKIDKLKIGEISETLETLHGIAIFKVEDRIPAVLQPFDRVAERAASLLLRERREEAWQTFLARLRSEANIVINDPAVAVSAAK
jgi:parvulin-like peptidyl-prolyl isomerase